MFTSRVEDERLLEVIQERLSDEFEKVQGYQGSTAEERILSLIRQVEDNAYNYGVMEVREIMRNALGFDIPANGWKKIK